MNEHSRRGTLHIILLGLSLLSILLLASGLPNLRFQPGEDLHILEWIMAIIASNQGDEYPQVVEEPSGSNIWLSLSEGTRDFLVIFFWLMLIFSIIYAIISPQFRRQLARSFVMITMLMIILPYIARRLVQEPAPVEAQGGFGQFSFEDAVFPVPPPFVQQPPDWFLLLAKVLLLVVIFVGIYLLWRRLRPKPDARAVVVKNIRQALSDLESGSELKDVVIASYAKMCRELRKSQGIRRHQAMTPHEFEVHLANAGITSAHIHQLTLLFEDVRYGAKPADRTTEHKAVQSLQAILQAYAE